MALNVPAGDTGNLSFGPGILFITTPFSVSNGTPNIDIGYVRGASLAVNRSRIDVYQGSPRTLVQVFANQEDATMQVTGLEWNLNNLKYVLGAGAVTSNTFNFGGTVTFDEVALLFRHRTPNEGTVEIMIYKAQGQGENTTNFGDDLQEFSYSWRALESGCTWTNNTLADGQKLIRVDYIAGA